MKRSQMIFTILLVPIDFLMLMISAITAYLFRIGSFVADIRPVIYALKFSDYLFYAVLTAVIWQIVFAAIGLYNIKSNRRLPQEFGKIFVGTSIGLLLIVFAIFLKRELFSSRFIIIAAWAISIILLTIGRAIILSIQKYYFKKGLALLKVVVIGSAAANQKIIQEISNNPNFGFKVVKTFNTLDQQSKEEIAAMHKEYYLDEIIVSEQNLNKEQMLEIIEFADTLHLGFRYVADIFNTLSSNVSIDTIAGVPLVELRKTPLDGWGKVIKRLFDLVISAILIIIVSPIMLLAALAIKLTSKGPVFFSRRDDGTPVQRIGQNGRPFTYFKFRSMYHKTDSLRYSEELQRQNLRADSPLVKIENDPRITPVGKFLRRFSIDELPELFLVFSGKMSLVGPRPHLPEEVAKYQQHHKKVLAIKPGITGMAQVSGRSDLSFDEEVKLDLYYIEGWSLWLDIQILLKTPLAVLRSRKGL